MDFMMRLPISTNLKSKSYDSIFVIVDRPTNIIYYKPVKTTIDASSFVKIIVNVVVRHHSLFNHIISDFGSVFTSTFWTLLCYFFIIKKRLSMAFYSRTNTSRKRQNSTLETYLQVFDYYKQDDQSRLLVIAESTYNNVKNTSID